MTTLFAACLARLGLSQPAAARLLNASPHTVKSWGAGRNPVPGGVWAELRRYEEQIVQRSETIRELFVEGCSNGPIQIDAVVDDAVGLMGLADFFLTSDALAGDIMVGVLPDGNGDGG